jgi:hypothetical protein
MLKFNKLKDLQDWIDVLQGKNVKDIDPKTKIEATLLRDAWIAENKRIENKIPEHDESFYKNIKEDKRWLKI